MWQLREHEKLSDKKTERNEGRVVLCNVKHDVWAYNGIVQREKACKEKRSLREFLWCEKWNMNGIQHLFRQQAVDKQTSIDSWHSANQSFASYSNGRPVSNNASPTHSSNGLHPPAWSQGKVELLFVIYVLTDNISHILQIAFSTNYTSRRYRRVHSPCRPTPNRHLRNSAVWEAITRRRAVGSAARRIPTRWWWAAVRMSWITMQKEFCQRPHRDGRVITLSAWAAHRCPVIQYDWTILKHSEIYCYFFDLCRASDADH